ncbi:cytochrome P450 [Lentinus tigrinus ALCF2SS1-7]|uniref:cytochrome P450 n=1 Tax=Lentinus tigrinus ALCF2SS1-7 TaxID=1328758 RepID=UPI001165E28B|nr:cytochrome P450 [Lentinus tigrinus ALCF2SS1-7]
MSSAVLVGLEKRTLPSVLLVVVGLLWKSFKQLVVRSPLDNLPGPPSNSFAYGNLRQLVSPAYGWGFVEHLTESYPGIARLRGPLGHRLLYIFDPLAMHHVVVKDAHIFETPSWAIKFNRIRFGPGIAASMGGNHRRQRKMLNPVFSIAHMRDMVPIFNEVGHKLVKALEDRVSGQTGPVEMDMLAWMGRTALELVGQAGLGYSFDPLVADTPDDFAMAIKAIPATLSKVNHLRRLMPYLPEAGRDATRRKIMGMIPQSGLQELSRISGILNRRSVEIYEDKKRALKQGDEAVMRQIGEGKDIMSILMRANMLASDMDRLPEDEVIAQMSTLIFAGMDTTSNALSRTLCLLAIHPDAQEKLRKEVLEASKNGDLGYDGLESLRYLDAVCRETMRIHPPVANIFRETKQDAVLPLSQPIGGVDGTTIREIPVPKGTSIAVGIFSSNRNKALWGEDAAEWKPERWLSALPNSIAGAKIPGVYSNFGFKFSQLEMKVVLCLLISKFTFELSEKPIVWNLSNISFPTVGNSPKSALPMKVGLYRSSTSVLDGF